MIATVAICTRNRAYSLARTLASIAAAELPAPATWELLIIDNGSSDGTAESAARFGDQLPLRCVFEPMAGLSHARNRAVAEANGRYVIWTDDDVLVDSKWLISYFEAFQRYPSAAVFGGKIMPLFEPPMPAWFNASLSLLEYPLGIRDFGDEVSPLSVEKNRLPFGANYAVRMLEQRKWKYNPALGVGPSQTRVGEETEVIRAILSEHGVGYWVPKSLVHHFVPREHQTIERIFRYYKAHGESRAFVEYTTGQCAKPLVPRWLWRRTAERFLRYYFARLALPPKKWVSALKDYAYDRGMLDYWRSQSRK